MVTEVVVKTAPIKTIALDSKGYLHVYPDVALCGDFKFIYRDASGIAWDEASQLLVARVPDRWEFETLFKQIISAVLSEYGIKLQITTTTIWSDIPEDLKFYLTK